MELIIEISGYDENISAEDFEDRFSDEEIFTAVKEMLGKLWNDSEMKVYANLEVIK